MEALNKTREEIAAMDQQVEVLSEQKRALEGEIRVVDSRRRQLYGKIIRLVTEEARIIRQIELTKAETGSHTGISFTER